MSPIRALPVVAAFFTLLFSAHAAAVPLGHAALVGDGIAEFVPSDYDAAKNPSLALVAEPVEQGAVPDAWKLRPAFAEEQAKDSATVAVPAGTSLYGGGEVTGPLLRNGKTITLWGTDTPAYSVDQGRRLYQAHPWVLGVRPDGTAFGLLFDTTWKATLATLSDRVEFRSEGPGFRVFVIDRPSPEAVLRGLAELTGTMALPPRWALGYQQCRYSYAPEAKARAVADGFRSRHIPCDVVWLDIDYMRGFRVFTFDPKGFPDPKGLNDYLHGENFHTVWMIDPGVKAEAGYPVYESGEKNNVWVQGNDGTEYHGKVWPGQVAFPDFTRPGTRAWWGTLYRDFLATGIDGIWNDMNEPAVFDGPKGTMPEDNRHRGGGGLPPGSHLEYHNVYGRLMVEATRDGILAARPDKRPFVLSRSNYLGGQRFAAAWTGDNASTPEHMRMSVPMSLTLGLSGQPFSGPDIGGFLGTPPSGLWGDWIGFGAFFPFCRGHACAGTPPKEPWAFGKETEDAARIALDRRYRLLPYLYTLFQESSTTGLPVMRPVFLADPKDPALRAEEQAFLLGRDLLVVPAFAQKPALPGGPWQPLSLVEGDGGKYQATLKLRGGAILPTGKVVESTNEKSLDPLTLYVALDGAGKAEGTLYLDAGDGWGFRDGDYALLRFSAVREGKTVTVRLDGQDGKRDVGDLPVRVEVLTRDGGHSASGTLRAPVTVPL